MRLLIAEKPHFARILRDKKLIEDDTEIVFTFGAGLWRYTIPRLSFKDIPFTSSPSSLRPQSFKPRKIFLGSDGKPGFCVPEELTATEHDSVLSSLAEYLKDQMGFYEEIICAVDVDRSGYGSAKQLLENIGWTESSGIPVHCLYFDSMDDFSLKKAWFDRAKHPWTKESFAETLAQQQMAKKTFDYWWNANSSIVFSELSTRSGLVASPLISKYELMLLCILADMSSPASKYTVINLMQKWKGSGKYDGDEWKWVGIGSYMSRDAIFNGAVQRGAIAVVSDSGGDAYVLSSAGRKFVSMLHNKTFDPDLPFRIEEWLRSGNYESMARYIRTVFGRQLRYQRSLGR